MNYPTFVKRLFVGCVSFVVMAPSAWSQFDLKSEDSWARKVMHFDESNKILEGITVAKKNPVQNTLEEMTYNQTEVLVTRRIFQMDSKGRIRNGLIFDGHNNLLGRTEYGFDKWDRIQQERLYTKKGKLVRALLYRYDVNGNPAKPIAYTFDPSDPSSKKRLSTDVEPVLPQSRHESDFPGIRITAPETGNRAPSNANLGIPLSGWSGNGAAAKNEDKPKTRPKRKRKGGFLRRLFGGDE